jgi:hypothetical protein
MTTLANQCTVASYSKVSALYGLCVCVYESVLCVHVCMCAYVRGILAMRRCESRKPNAQLLHTAKFLLSTVCICAYECVFACACVHVCMCACVHVCMCACVHVCMCACVRVCVCMYASKHVCVGVYAFVSIFDVYAGMVYVFHYASMYHCMYLDICTHVCT